MAEFFSQIDRALSSHTKKEVKRAMVAAMQVGMKSSWPEIFHAGFKSRHNILAPKKMKEYEKVVLSFLGNPSPKYENENKAAADLLEYIRTHRLDPDNSMVGLRPAENVIHQYCGKLLKKKPVTTALQLRSKDTCSSSTIPRFINAQLDLSSEALINQILEWDELMNNPVDVADRVHKFATRLRENYRCQPGDLVLAVVFEEEHSGSVVRKRGGNHASRNIFYCRVAQNINSVVVLKISPDEKKTRSIPSDYLIPLPFTLKKLFGDSATMRHLVYNPVEDFLNQIADTVNEEVFAFISQHKIDDSLLQRSLQKNVSFKDLNDITTTANHLQLLLTAPGLKTLDKQMADSAFSRSRAFKHTVNTQELFLPNMEEINNPIGIVKRSNLLATQRLQYLISNCLMNIEYLKIEKEKILSGRMKRELTQWWLDHIDNTVYNYLLVRGFDFNTVPNNYIDYPPQSIEAVKKNLTIIQQILLPPKNQKEAEAFKPVLEFIEALANEVYLKIDAYVDSVLFLLVEYLQFDSLPKIPLVNDTQINVSKIKRAFEQRKKLLKRLDHLTHERMMDLLKDVEYISAMKSMEKLLSSAEIAQGQGRHQMSDVVPIRGLILSCFARMEKELHTVLELWDNSTPETGQPRRSERKMASLGMKSDPHPILQNRLSIWGLAAYSHDRS